MDRLIALRANMSTASLDDYETAAEESSLSLYTSCIDVTIDNNETLSGETDFNNLSVKSPFCQSNLNTVKKASPIIIPPQARAGFNAETNDNAYESDIETGIDKLEDSLPLDAAMSYVAKTEQNSIAENATSTENDHQSARNIASVVVDSLKLENNEQPIEQNISLSSSDCSLLSGTAETIVDVIPSTDISNDLEDYAVQSRVDIESTIDLNNTSGAAYLVQISEPEVSVQSAVNEHQPIIDFDENKENDVSKAVVINQNSKYALRRSILPIKTQPQKPLRQSLTSEFRKQLVKRPSSETVVARRLTRLSIVASSLTQIHEESNSKKIEMIPGNL